MKSILKHTVLAALFCICMATHLVANDVQVKIPESSLQVIMDKMIEARAFCPRSAGPLRNAAEKLLLHPKPW